jgi:hypothetical protein
MYDNWPLLNFVVHTDGVKVRTEAKERFEDRNVTTKLDQLQIYPFIY